MTYVSHVGPSLEIVIIADSMHSSRDTIELLNVIEFL